MNLLSSMLFRPSSAISLLALTSLIVVLSLTPCWYIMVKHIEHRVNSNTQHFLSELQYQIHHSAELLHIMNSSSTNLARLMSSTFNHATISFSDIETKAAPMLFQAFETIPHLSEISYIGMQGFFFSYSIDHDQALALYSNSSSSSKIVYYVQQVNRDTGGLHGEATIYDHPVNATWIEKAINSSNGYASLGSKWSNNHDLLYLSSARISNAGVISLGFSATTILDFVTDNIERQGASLYLVTKDGKVVEEGIFRHTQIVFSNDMASFKPGISINGDKLSYEGTVSCKDEASASALKIGDTRYLACCSSVDIMRVESVYILAVPQNGLVSFMHKSTKQGLVLLSSMIVLILVSIFSFVLLNAIMGRREMHLCASLIKQMEATHQAERKSMNKSIAFASASHDVRLSLAGLITLIETSFEEVVPGSEVEANLKDMDNSTKDLLGLLNSILDTSKIEAGKMELAEEEFDLFQLVEDALDLFHPLAMKNGVDLVLDHCDGSVIRYSHVKGDRGKLKQVLSNLLGNAVKFTDEGHIVVRAWTQKPSFENSITASNRYSFMKRLSCLFYKKDEADVDVEAVSSIQQDPNCMEFVFEVDDTGKGIPKEKHKSVFENYVQVKETALGQYGTGLGLGIVQSLVRLMHGDIGIVDKDIGEKGTCFRFSVLLKTDLEEPQGLDIPIQTPTSSGSSICSPSSRLPIFTYSRPESSCVIIFIQGVARRRATRRFMKSLGIKVKVVKQWEHFSHTLKKIKQKGHNLRSTSQTSLSAADANDGTSLGFILLVIDASAEPFEELHRVVSEFKKVTENPHKVVWLNGFKLKAVEENVLDPDDIVMSRPFHGTRLLQVIKLLPEFTSSWPSISGKAESDILHNRFRKSLEQREHGNSSVQEYGNSSYEKPLSGKNFLVAEDTGFLRRIVLKTLTQLGANTVEECENGEEAVKLVEEALSGTFPYDYILMDCEMPLMNGFEATRRIREIEKGYGVHIPIIALTAHTSGKETKMTIEAGMDVHLSKPLRKEDLLEAIRYIRIKNELVD